jgi:lipid-A-disaccharide synthase
VLIGNDVFNVFLARALRRLGVPTIAYFPPQVWVWRSLAGFIARSFDAIITSFPDEHRIYRAADSTALVSFAGHYLADDLHPVGADQRVESRAVLQLPTDPRVVGVLPGSRHHEWTSLTPVLLDAVDDLARRDPALRFVVAAADTIDDRAVAAIRERNPSITISRDSRAVMRSADLLLMASGTATLEAALLGVPMVIAYKVSAITHLVVRAAIRVGLIESYRVGLPNLVLERAAVPEVLQQRATGPIVAEAAWSLLASPERMAEVRSALGGVSTRLRGAHPIEDVAESVLSWADGRRPALARPARVRRSPQPGSLRPSEPD